MEITHKTLGYVLAGIAIFLLVILVFVKADFDTQSAALCDSYSKSGMDMNLCPVHSNSTSWMLVLAFGIGFLMLGAGIYLSFMPAEKPPLIMEEKKEFKQIDLTKLDEDEKKIYGILKGKGGSAYQSDLVNETSFSKVKITRILDKLEMMNILERRRRGMTNIIVLK